MPSFSTRGPIRRAVCASRAGGGDGVATWLQSDGLHASSRATDGTWSAPVHLGRARNGDAQAVAASAAGSAIAWHHLGDDRNFRLHVLLVPREGTPRPIVLAEHPASLDRPHSRPPQLVDWTIRGRRGSVRVTLRCRGSVRCEGVLQVGNRTTEYGMSPGRARRYTFPVPRRRKLTVARLHARVHGRLYPSRSRRVRLR